MPPALTHERLSARYRFDGTLIMKTGLHIGSGRASLLTDALVIRSARGAPYIPGSSFKGALRSAVERIAPNLGHLNPPVKSCQLIEDADDECLTVTRKLKEWFQQIRELCDSARRAGRSYRAVAGDEEAKRLTTDGTASGVELDSLTFARSLPYRFIERHLCDTCRVFGSTSFAAKVRVGDLSVREPWVDTTEIRDGVGIDRDTETARPKIKFDLEVVPAQTEFSFRLDAENLTARELGLLCIGLQEFRSELVPLGGRSSRGLGGCRLILDVVYSANLEDVSTLIRYLTSDEGERMRRHDPDQFIKDSVRAMIEEGGV